MDFVDGTDAAHLLSDNSEGLPVGDVGAIVYAIAEALDFAHQRGLLHRDMKPANILMTEGADQRRILLADFGIGREISYTSGLTATNMTVGTVSYAAPEQLMGEPIDGRADQYDHSRPETPARNAPGIDRPRPGDRERPTMRKRLRRC